MIETSLAQEFSWGVDTSQQPFVEAVSVQKRIAGHADRCGSQVDIAALKILALRSLASLFDEEEKLFYRRVILTDDRILQERTSRKRTIVALLGLQRLAEFGGPQPFDVASIRDAVLADSAWVRSIGDLGLLIWFTAECAPERLGKLLKDFDLENSLESSLDGRQGRTEGLACFLAGIAHARLACRETLPDLTDIAVDTYRLLQENQSEGGIFGNAAFPGLLQQTFCNRFGTFSDQMCAIYGLTTFGRAFQIEEPLESALSCANSVRALQGEMGQWWFLYDKYTCRVVNRYPVCSRHQDGTAPVALLALGEATGQSFHEPISKGLSWIVGTNELGIDLRNLDRGLIWDSIGPKRHITNIWEAALSFMNISRRPQQDRVKIRYEARPDHFGWLLYAFSSIGLPKEVELRQHTRERADVLNGIAD